MKPLPFVILTLIFLFLLAPLRVARSALLDWQTVGSGIDYQKFVLPDPNNVYVARMHRDNLSTTIESSIGQGRLSGDAETVSDMARRYDGAINYWGQVWGNTNQVVVAINGFYFGPDVEPPGVPWSGQVYSGWYAKRFWELESSSGFAWKLDRSAFIGECVTHPPDKQIVYYIHGGDVIASQMFDGINVPRDKDEFILYTPQYDATTRTDGSGSVEVLVELTRPSLIALTSDMTGGRIVEIRKSLGDTPIPFNNVVLSMQGTAQSKFLGYDIKVGDEIGIAQKVKNCDSSLPFEWDNTYASVGGAFYFLKDGVIQDFSDDPQANVRDPRTAVAFNNDYIFFIVVDGRDSQHSVGMKISQLAAFAKDVLGAKFGIAQDGGGSSTMVVNGEVVNNTYCNIVDCDRTNSSLSTAPPEGEGVDRINNPSSPILPFPLVDGTDQPPPLSADGFPLTEEYYQYRQDALQRLVANGLMMVVVKSKEQTSTFTTSELVFTTATAQVRLGPGTNYGLVSLVDPGNQGIVLEQGLNGVKAKGSNWWKVLLEVGDNEVTGWTTEDTLVLPRLEFIPAVLMLDSSK